VSRIAHWAAGAGVTVAMGLAGAPAMADRPAKAHSLRWEPALDASVTAGGAVAWIASEAFKGELAPSRCRWCNVDTLDARVRQALVWHATESADTLSNLLGFAVMPLVSVGLDAIAADHDGALGDTPEDGLLIGEAAVITADVDQLTKLFLGRERPFVHMLAPAEKRRTPHPADNNLSFFSGHASEAFALAAASGTIGVLRGYRWAPLEWSVGCAVAATTAYLRIAADRHWLTDVLVGMALGAGIGFAVPYFFHSAQDDSPRVSSSAALRAQPLPAGAAMTVAW
jgi:hypothetical protein